MTGSQHPPDLPPGSLHAPYPGMTGTDGAIPLEYRPIAGRKSMNKSNPNSNGTGPVLSKPRPPQPVFISQISSSKAQSQTQSPSLFRSPLYVSGQSALPSITIGGPDDDAFDATFEGNHDEYETAIHAGRKKRKTPAFQLSSGPGRHEGFAVYDGDVVDGTDRHANLAPVIYGRAGEDGIDDRDDEGDDDQEGREDDRDGNGEDEIDAAESATLALQRQIRSQRRLRSIATQTCDFRRLQFLRRKAALITLFLDATSAIKQYWKDEKSGGAHTISKNLVTKLPEVDSFEKLLPLLEDVGVGEWPADKPEWRNGWDDQPTKKRLGVWRTKFAKRRKIIEGRKEIVRGGWAPEGSFELEVPSKCKLRYIPSRPS
jgi:hypothetical protein